jgi:hypothetical protein
MMMMVMIMFWWWCSRSMSICEWYLLPRSEHLFITTNLLIFYVYLTSTSIYLSQGDYIAIAILAKLYYIGSPKTPKNILKSNEYGKKCFEYLIELTKKVKDDMFILTLLGYFYQYKIGINILSSIIIIIIISISSIIIIICIISIVKIYYSSTLSRAYSLCNCLFIYSSFSLFIVQLTTTISFDFIYKS